jgi:IclR family transcriptional regulator, acetate operon repressor
MSITKERLSPSPAIQPRATDRGLRLLSVVSDHPSGVALADAARSTELSPSTALRQLRSLESAGFAVHLADGRWAPGDELFRIARALTTVDSLARMAQPLLVALAEQTGESTYLAEPRGKATAVYVAMEPSRHAIRHVSWLGRILDRKSTAVGAALKGRVDGDGTAMLDDAVEVGVTAISAPVRDCTEAIVAAVSVVGPTYRLKAFGTAEVRALVAETAATLSAKLDGTPKRKLRR